VQKRVQVMCRWSPALCTDSSPVSGICEVLNAFKALWEVQLPVS
jgi:hypothetical protein